MDTKYSEKYFINPAIEYGIRAYRAVRNGEAINKAYTFELYVINVLCIIYGEKSLLLPYNIDNEKAFECNLLMYDLKESDMYNFIKYMNEYYSIMDEFKSEEKAAGLIYEIERILIEMINKRASKTPFNEKELAAFDTIFNRMSIGIENLKATLATEEGLIKKYWHETKMEMGNTTANMIAVNPQLLNSQVYKKYGYDIRTIACLTEDEIKAVNKVIVKEENRHIVKEKPSFFQKYNLVFSTGNGFVDKLLVISVAATELMIGAVILAALLR